MHYFTYGLKVLDQNSNATVHFWYTFLYEAKPLPINLWFTISAICGTMIILFIIKRRKSS